MENTLRSSILEDALVSIVLGLPGHHSSDLEKRHPTDLAPSIVRHAEEYMAEHLRNEITPSLLVAVCGCSRSALFYNFKAHRNYTPMQFLAARRLEIAQQRLMQEPGVTVTVIALDCGFSNHGRFAKAYRNRFGEAPSATRARHLGPLCR
jgi:AraC-like DNA-binding protein